MPLHARHGRRLPPPQQARGRGDVRAVHTRRAEYRRRRRADAPAEDRRTRTAGTSAKPRYITFLKHFLSGVGDA